MQATHVPSVSVLMPTYEQAAFIRRALDSLQAQTLADWELLVVDASHSDTTAEAVQPWLQDPRIRYLRIPENGLGHALNHGLAQAQAPLVAYLPSDDVYYRDHLQSLKELLDSQPQAVLAHSGVRHHYNREVPDRPPSQPLQLVQCMHRRTDLRWIEREEIESDDLERLYWARLRETGEFLGSGRVSCEWVDHPMQRHKLMQEPIGGINPFRLHYRVRTPLRFHTTVGNLIDEPRQYRRLRERADTPPAQERLRILLVGELAYNADRVLALEEQGHELHGLWMREPYWYNTVGPLPFGHVRDLPRDDWRRALRELKPDLIYALLNWQAVPFAHEVMSAAGEVPFVWHFKEGPFICLEKGTWPQLVDLHRRADGQIFSSPEMRDWFDTVVPGLSAHRPTHVLDGDLPKRDWFEGPFSLRLSAADGEIHTVVPGRPIGLHPPDVAALAERGIHLHFYGDFTHGQWRQWIEKTRTLAPRHLHLHANVDQSRWVEEFSRYDAGWLHSFRSVNEGELRRANWDDLNYPARMATLAVAGLPMIQQANPGSIVATQTLCERLGTGVLYRDFDDLAQTLRDAARMKELQQRVQAQRHLFSFDHHVPALVDFFRTVIAGKGA
ncbi:glycosyltransferase [Caldimonas tepidiphila]|uniref:glycosyltransferase n=1 Tax=Caldimonas tepidiphila TaxID=2315841 RepID=UPI000E5A5BDD|nr:glycosyltransferase [Caldimonas tepidiphila]